MSRYLTSKEATQRICWKTIEFDETYYCLGDECMAWQQQPVEGRETAKDDISPRGHCMLLQQDVWLEMDT